jgi:hypothetical protein
VDATNLIEPTYLILAVIAWLVLGLLITRKVPARWRLAWLMVWLIPTIGLVSEALHIRNGMREDARKSAKIFADFKKGVSPHY